MIIAKYKANRKKNRYEGNKRSGKFTYHVRSTNRSRGLRFGTKRSFSPLLFVSPKIPILHERRERERQAIIRWYMHAFNLYTNTIWRFCGIRSFALSSRKLETIRNWYAAKSISFTWYVYVKYKLYDLHKTATLRLTLVSSWHTRAQTHVRSTCAQRKKLHRIEHLLNPRLNRICQKFCNSFSM